MTPLTHPAAWAPRGIAELEADADVAVRGSVNTAVVAGPGAGKTELLAQRACFLLETGGCPMPRRVLAISFKRDAARNLRDRVVLRAGSGLGRRFDSHTFDAFAKSIVDQFMAALPVGLRPTTSYDVIPGSPRGDDVALVFDGMRPPPELGTRNDLRAFESERFFRERVLGDRLTGLPRNLEEWAAQEFWRQQLLAGERSKLYFGMIGRLANGLVRLDGRVRRAYRATYSHVFLDEFQDTTGPQYALTRDLFHGTGAILTAVGDPQQRIMGWAGALPNAFDVFAKEFEAVPKRLRRNRRASAEIAPVVRYLAARLRDEAGEAEAAEIEALAGGGPPPEACGGYVFADDAAEAEWIAAEIDGLIASGVPPRDICILARMRAGDYGSATIAALQRRGLTARLEETMQDLLSEPVVTLVLSALRALLGARPGAVWSRFRGEIAVLNGVADDDLVDLDRTLTDLRAALRAAMPSVPDAPDTLRALVREHIEMHFARPMRGRYPQYQRGVFYEQTLHRLCTELVSAGAGKSWEIAIATVEGADAVPILTIHKSKGLEYAAVFFLGLEDGAFWGFRKSRAEELSAFFVAISRAKTRVAFTFAKRRTLRGQEKRQSREQIRELYELLTSASVPITHKESE